MNLTITYNNTYIKCICGSTKYDTIISSNDFKIIKCTKCNLSRTYPVPCELNQLYSGKEYIQYYVENKKLFTSFMKKVVNEVQIFKKKGKLLEIGCSVGYLLEIAKKEGFEPYGVELNPAAVDFANNMLGGVVKNKTLQEANFDENYFDVVVMNHVLEHIPDIPELLNEIHRILKADGILVISVPNFGSLIARIQEERWYGLVPAQHLWQFTPETLSSLLRQRFRIMRISTNNLHRPLMQRIFWRVISVIGKGDNLFITAVNDKQ